MHGLMYTPTYTANNRLSQERKKKVQVRHPTIVDGLVLPDWISGWTPQAAKKRALTQTIPNRVLQNTKKKEREVDHAVNRGFTN